MKRCRASGHQQVLYAQAPALLLIPFVYILSLPNPSVSLLSKVKFLNKDCDSDKAAKVTNEFIESKYGWENPGHWSTLPNLDPKWDFESIKCTMKKLLWSLVTLSKSQDVRLRMCVFAGPGLSLLLLPLAASHTIFGKVHSEEAWKTPHSVTPFG